MATSSSDRSVRVLMAHQSGETSRNSIARLITATAGALRPRMTRCSEISHGQVATTIIAAQTVAARKGRKTQSDSAISAARKSTARVFRVRSWCMSGIRARVGACDGSLHTGSVPAKPL